MKKEHTRKFEEGKDIRKIKEIYKDRDIEIYKDKKEKYIIIYDTALNIKTILNILNKCMKYFEKEGIEYLFIFIDDETMQYHSNIVISGKCFPMMDKRTKKSDFSIITIRIGTPMMNLWGKVHLFITLWNELYHSIGEKGKRFPTRKIIKENFPRWGDKK